MVFPVVGGDGKPTGYEVSNSLRLTDNGYLNRTRSSPTDTKGTFSAWIKTAAQNSINLAGGASSVNDRAYIYFPSSGDGFSGGIFSRISGSANMNFSTSAVYRDPAAWYHLVVAIDSTQSTESNRVKWYVNGEQVTSFSSASYPSQNGEIPLFSKAAHTIGASYGASSISNWSDGYIAEVYYADGTQYAASDFGETNDNGVWVPKEAKDDISFGNEGFYLEFKQTGTSANSSGIGADTSGNDNHLTVNGLAATDVTVDTPTNNFCTVNPLGGATSSGKWTFSEGNTQIQQNDNGNWRATGSTMAVANGKWYWEIEFDAGTLDEIFVGVHDSDVSLEGTNRWVTGSTLFYNHVGGEIRQDGTNTDNNYGELDHGDILGVALNMDDKKISFYDNGSAIISNFSLSSGITGFAMPTFMSDANNVVYKVNFGNPPFSVSSGNADANGYGNFEYAVPSGYYALCTKNLAEFG